MNGIEDLYKIYEQSGNLHHAHLVIGERDFARHSIFTFLQEKLNVSMNGNPDFSYVEYGTFNIEAARNLAVPQSMKDVGGERKFFIIAVDLVTEEAQNALLKIFEEPTAGTHFFIIAPQNNFLPTFLSRMHLVRLGEMEKNTKVLKKDFPQHLVERLAFVVKLAGEISDEKKTKQDAIDLVNQIEIGLYNNVDTKQQDIKKEAKIDAKALKACEFARSALMSRGAMVKMILENLVLQQQL